MTWERARAAPVAASSATGSRGRHRAPEREDVDELTDTVAISALCLSYGQHAVRTPGPPLRPGTGLCALPVGDDGDVPEYDIAAEACGSNHRSAAGRIAHAIAGLLRPWSRSA